MYLSVINFLELRRIATSLSVQISTLIKSLLKVCVTVEKLLLCQYNLIFAQGSNACDEVPYVSCIFISTNMVYEYNKHAAIILVLDF